MNENNINSNLEQNVQNNMEELPTSNITEEAPSTEPVTQQPVINEIPSVPVSETPVTPTEVKKKNNTPLIIILIILGLLLIGGGVFLAIKFLFSKNNPEPIVIEDKTKKEDDEEEVQVLYTFEDPLGNTISLIKKPYLREEYIGVDFSRYEKISDEIKDDTSVITEEEYKALNLSDDYNRAFKIFRRAIKSINGSGFSVTTAKTQLKYDLKFEDPPIKDEVVEYVVNNSKINWNDQVLIAVYKYLGWGKSKEYIHDKLVKDEFSEKQIEYAETELADIDYYEQAVEAACSERFKKQNNDIEDVREKLIKEKFTTEEIDYAIKVVFEEIK